MEAILAITPDSLEADTRDIPQGTAREIQAAIKGLRSGSVEIIVYDGNVIEIDRREKVAEHVGMWKAVTSLWETTRKPLPGPNERREENWQWQS